MLHDLEFHANRLRLLTPKDICDVLGVAKKMLDSLIAAGEFIPPFKIGDKERWRRRDVERFFRARASMSHRLRFGFDATAHTIKAEPMFKPGDYPEELKEVHASLLEYTLFNKMPCVYFLINFGEIVYVGRSRQMPGRVYQHMRGDRDSAPKVFNRVLYLHVEDEKLDQAEAYFIKLLNPPLNRVGVVLDAD